MILEENGSIVKYKRPVWVLTHEDTLAKVERYLL